MDSLLKQFTDKSDVDHNEEYEELYRALNRMRVLFIWKIICSEKMNERTSNTELHQDCCETAEEFVRLFEERFKASEEAQCAVNDVVGSFNSMDEFPGMIFFTQLIINLVIFL